MLGLIILIIFFLVMIFALYDEKDDYGLDKYLKKHKPEEYKQKKKQEILDHFRKTFTLLFSPLMLLEWLFRFIGHFTKYLFLWMKWRMKDKEFYIKVRIERLEQMEIRRLILPDVPLYFAVITLLPEFRTVEGLEVEIDEQPLSVPLRPQFVWVNDIQVGDVLELRAYSRNLKFFRFAYDGRLFIERHLQESV